VLYLLDIRQIGGNANFKNEFHNGTKKLNLLLKLLSDE